MTFAEFEQLPEQGRRHELCHGEPKERPAVKWGHLIRQEKLRGLLAEAAGGAGLVVTEFSFRPVPEYEGRTFTQRGSEWKKSILRDTSWARRI